MYENKTNLCTKNFEVYFRHLTYVSPTIRHQTYQIIHFTYLSYDFNKWLRIVWLVHKKLLNLGIHIPQITNYMLWYTKQGGLKLRLQISGLMW